MSETVIKNIQRNRLQGIPLKRCLTECEKNEVLKVTKVMVGKKARQRLANLGIIPGVEIIKSRSAPLKGPLEIKIKSSSLIIGRGIASKIFVKCGEECIE